MSPVRAALGAAACLALCVLVAGANEPQERARTRAGGGSLRRAPASTIQNSGDSARPTTRSGAASGGGVTAGPAGSGGSAPAGTGSSGITAVPSGSGGTGSGGTGGSGGSSGPVMGPSGFTTPFGSPSPTLVSVRPGGCIESGDRLSVRGTQLGLSSAGRSLRLSGSGAPLALAVSYWSSTRIDASVPTVPGGTAYQLEVAQQGNAVSNALALQSCGVRVGIQSLPDPPPGSEPPPGLIPGPAPPSNPPIGRPVGGPPTPPRGGAPGSDPGADGAAVVSATAAAHTPGRVLILVADGSEADALPARVVSLLGLSQVRVERRTSLGALGGVLVALQLPASHPAAGAVPPLVAAGLVADLDHSYRAEQGETSPKLYAASLIGIEAPSPVCGRGLRLGLVDGAVDAGHPALAGSRTVQHSVLPEGESGGRDHGTALAALLVGGGGDVAGIVPGAELFVAAAFRRAGDGVEASTEGIVRGADWLVAQGVHVVNLSLSGPANRVLGAAVDAVLRRGVAVVAAAGNQGPEAPAAYPAAHPGVLAVTAVDARLRPYRKANRGDYVALAAPGVDVWTALADGRYSYVSGTSYAAPFVSAALGVARAANPGASPRELAAQLTGSSRDLGASGRDPVFGHGLLQIPQGCSAEASARR